MIYLYLFGTCFHFIYVFMIIWKVILLLFEWLSYDIPHATSFSPLCATTEIISSSLAISTFSFSNGFK